MTAYESVVKQLGNLDEESRVKVWEMIEEMVDNPNRNRLTDKELKSLLKAIHEDTQKCWVKLWELELRDRRN